MITGIVAGSKGQFQAVPMLGGAQVATPLPFVPVWKTSTDGVVITAAADGLTAEIDPGTNPAGSMLACSVENADGTAVSSFSVPVLAPPPPPSQATIVDSYEVSQLS